MLLTASSRMRAQLPEYAERVLAFFSSEGLYCYDHEGELRWKRDFGVLDSGAPRLPEERGFPLLAEEFRAAGYATAGFVSSAVLGEATGIAAGLEHFESPSFGEPWSDEQGDVLAPERVAAAEIRGPCVSTTLRTSRSETIPDPSRRRSRTLSSRACQR